MIRPIIPALLLFSWSMVQAHLDSLFVPVGGASYTAGEVVNIQWSIGNNHNGIDVYLSTDDKTWTLLIANMLKTATRYNWTVPAQPTDRARIRVCQKSGPEGCTDADSLSNPIDGPLYTLVSGRFHIVANSTAIHRIAAPAPERLLIRGSANRSWTPIRSFAWDLRGRSRVKVDRGLP